VADTDTLTLPEIQAQILQKYLTERQTGASAYTQKHFVSAAYSKCMRFKSDDEEDDDEDDMDDQLRAIMLLKAKGHLQN